VRSAGLTCSVGDRVATEVSIADIGKAECLCLRTFRSNGTAVDTPVWVVQIDQNLAFFSDDRAFKWKRLQRNPMVEVCASNRWGYALGPWQPGVARPVTDPARIQRIYDLIAAKYGIHWKLATVGKKLRNELHHRSPFEVTVTPRAHVPGAVLAAIDIQKVYVRGSQVSGAAVVALRGVSLAAHAGEVVAIIGPSGSGKSTLLSLLGALDHATAGEITVDGVCLSNLGDSGRAKLRRERIGFVFQFFNLLPLLSARDNVALPMLVAGMARRDAEARAGALLTRVGLAARMKHRPDELSGGEMQRVAVARALGPKPAVLLADEPTGNLDSATGDHLLELLGSIAREDRCAVVMVTHDPKAAAVADRVIELRDGVIMEPDANAEAQTGSVSA
jgi:putative ABC transport system ATP-binding protein